MQPFSCLRFFLSYYARKLKFFVDLLFKIDYDAYLKLSFTILFAVTFSSKISRYELIIYCYTNIFASISKRNQETVMASGSMESSIKSHSWKTKNNQCECAQKAAPLKLDDYHFLISTTEKNLNGEKFAKICFLFMINKLLLAVNGALITKPKTICKKKHLPRLFNRFLSWHNLLLIACD